MIIVVESFALMNTCAFSYAQKKVITMLNLTSPQIQELKSKYGEDAVSEIPYYSCEFCHSIHARTSKGKALFQDHFIFRNMALGISIVGIVKGGRDHGV